MRAITSNKWVFLLVIFLVLSNLALVFIAFTNGGERNRGRQDDWMKKQLNLTNEQDKLFNEKKDAFMNLMKPRREEVNQLKDSLYLHLGDITVPDSLVNYYTEKWSEKSQENDAMTFRHFQELRKHCTEAQKRGFDSLITSMVTRRWYNKK
jgi:hypothetical protein